MIRIFLFASPKQMELVRKKNIGKEPIVMIGKKYFDDEYNSDEKIIYIKPDDYKSISNLKNEASRVLCCHEEGLFWLKNNDSALWELGFDRNYLNLFKKTDFKKYINGCDIKTVEIFCNQNYNGTYPIIAKPEIGFGSIGVMMIRSIDELSSYTTQFNDMISVSGINKYQNIYFKDLKNSPVFEKYYSGTFYRTPFLIENGICTYIFPLEGITTSSKAFTDFHWHEFEYNPRYSLKSNKAKEIAEKLARIFKLRNGSYVMEYIVDFNDKIYLLEFSPRQTSSRLSHLIELSIGLSLEEIAIELYEQLPLKKIDFSNAKTIRLRLENKNDIFNDIQSKYILIEKNSETSVYNEVINCCYYERNDCY